MEAAEKKYMHDLAKLEDLFIKADIPPSCKAHEKNERKEKSPRAVRLRRMSRDELLNAVWGYNYIGETRTVDVHIQRLRGKIGAERIETIIRYGYRFREDV